MTRYIVVQKEPLWPDMHVLPNGSMSMTGKPKKFFSKEAALEVAREWAQLNEDCQQFDRKVIVRKVD